MNFRDKGIIIAKNALKENYYIIDVFTENHGLYSGLVRQYKQKNGDILAEANLVDFFWQARLHEHLGSAKCELVKSYSGFIMQDKLKLYAFNSVTALIKKAFCEREPHNRFFPKLLKYLDTLKTNKFSFKDYIQLEIDLLAETGYQISLNKCVVTGQTHDLGYVSPKSGHAVSYEIGETYKDKLLILPQFLHHDTEPSSEEKTASIPIDFLLFKQIYFTWQAYKRERAVNLFIIQLTYCTRHIRTSWYLCHDSIAKLV